MKSAGPGRRPERPTLVILAAGRSTRFGRAKQLEPVGPGGESLLEYAVHDALRAGFGRFVLVVRESQRHEFEARLGPLRTAGVALSFACQRLAHADLVPLPPPGRVRPWGTGFAVLAAAAALPRRGPFAVCNADDFYGRAAYQSLARSLAAPPPGVRAFTVTYPLAGTLSAFGGVSRGLCEAKPDGTLLHMTEGLDLRLERDPPRTGSGAESAAARPAVAGRTPAGTPIRVDADSQACMGLWGFFPDILPLLAERFRAFLAASPGANDEFYLSEAVSDLAAAGRARCGLLRAGEGWMGLTFPGDRAGTAASLRQLTAAGAYPADLWTPPVRPAPARRAQAPSVRPPQAPPSGVAIAPGRINLIGEHLDYNGLSVLPMALERNIRLEFEVLRQPAVELTGDADHGPFAFRLDRPIEPAPQGHWSNYVRATARGLLDHGVELKRGIGGKVTGTVPVAEGLSSSSALVVASALALLHANEKHVGVLELAALLARAERFVGLQGGGMDQAASLCGAKGHALRIDFRPLRVTPVPVPEGWRWVVASSLARAEKAGAWREPYNERRAQCTEALKRLGRASWLEVVEADEAEFASIVAGARRSLPPTLWRRFRHVATEGRRVIEAEAALRREDMAAFGRLMNASHASLRDDFGVSTAALDEIVGVALDAGAAGARPLARAKKAGAARKPYNERRAQCAEALERLGRASWLEVVVADEADFASLLAGARRSLPPTLWRRFRHVATEGRRVIEAEAALRREDMAAFGSLMNASHASLRDDFGVSTEALDEIVGVARDAGAAGARLTGAGFGGCAIALCRASRAEDVMAALRERFYAPRGGVGNGALFVATASGGATVTC